MPGHTGEYTVFTCSRSRCRVGIEFEFTVVLLSDLEVVDSESESAMEFVMSATSNSSWSSSLMSSDKVLGSYCGWKDGRDSCRSQVGCWSVASVYKRDLRLV
ncbi:hypothetical protein M404DRAFT_827732 [Pisolithus tinctorius Marx 270]|uniref:Uncharacterized protein n=1 Tax=Pisolithus tinctorius Marx 270 TaxID=870435 RepID=A0A0C3NC74_PISTI|nr:hypothetical protein M404DRAFT_827732 [Pisolithus tinctorius Marx 270]